MANRITFPIFKYETSAGAPAVGYKVNTYEAGTSTPLTTYSDNGSTPNANPVVLNSQGEAEIWVTESCKIIITDADDSAVLTVDNIDPTTVNASQVSNTVFADVSSTNVQDTLEELKTDIDAKADPSDITDSGFGEMSTGVTMQGFLGGDAALDTDTAHDIAFQAFRCKNHDNTQTIYSTGVLTKQIDAAWAAGDDAGGLLNGTVAANTCYLWVAMGDGSTGVDIGFLALADVASISTHVTAAGFDYYKIFGYWHTNASSDWAGFTNNGKYLIADTASENILDNGVTTSFAVADHLIIAGDYTEKIWYGAMDAAVTGYVYASDDGTNVSMIIADVIATTSDTSVSVWGSRSQNVTGFVPYLSTRQFIANTGTVDLLLHGVKFKR